MWFSSNISFSKSGVKAGVNFLERMGSDNLSIALAQIIISCVKNSFEASSIVGSTMLHYIVENVL